MEGGVVPTLYIPLALPPLGTTPLLFFVGEGGLFLPPPLWGRAGVGGVGTPCPPNPLPTRERGGSANPIYPPWHYPLGTTPPWERGAFPEPRTKRSGVSGAAEATYSASPRARLRESASLPRGG